MDIEARTDWIVELDEAQAEELLEAVGTADRFVDDLFAMRREDFPLPGLDPLLARAVDELVNGCGVTLFRGLPLDGLEERQIELLFWGLGLHMGTALPQGPGGDQPLAHVRDEGVDRHATKGGALMNRHSGALPVHTDSSDVVGLLCIHPALEGGVSTLVSTAAVHDEIFRRRPDLLEVMYEPWWFDRRLGDGPESFVQCPIFALNGSGRLFAFYGPDHYKSASRGEGIPPLTQAQWDAMGLLEEISARQEVQLHMSFRRGDAQFINNYAVMHSRTAYEDAPDPLLRRDLIRLWISLDRDLDSPPSFAERGFVSRATAAKPG